MGFIKQAYSAVMRGVSSSGVFDSTVRAGVAAEPGSWRRWAASLFAIHDVERMIALDVPWWNVEAASEVAQHLAARPNARVFEYGSGASSVWLARRAGEVTAVDHDRHWYDLVGGLVKPHANVTLLHRDLAGRGYVDAVAEVGGTFDLIVVDGRRRGECLAAARSHLKPGGIVLFDDTGRRRYTAAIRASGLRARRHFGRSYCVPYPDFSTVLYG